MAQLRRLAQTGVLGCLWAAFAAPAAPPPWPVAPPRSEPAAAVVQPAEDPYRDLENTRSPAVAAWMRAHSDHAHAVLRSVNGRAALRDKLAQFDDAAADRITHLSRGPGDLVFYLRSSSQGAGSRLALRQGLQGREVLLPALAGLATLKSRTGQPRAISQAVPAPGGRWVALSLWEGGETNATLRVLDTRTGRPLGRDVEHVAGSGLSWLPDGSGLFFFQQPPLPRPRSTDVWATQPAELMTLKPGPGAAPVRTLVQPVPDPGATRTTALRLHVQPDGRVLLVAGSGNVSANTSTNANEQSVWHSTVQALLADRPDWKQLAGPADRVSAVALLGDRYHALTSKDAPRQKLLGGKLGDDGLASAAVLIPESDRVLAGLAVARDALYVAVREGPYTQLLRRAHQDDAATTEVPLPVLGTFNLGPHSASADLSGVLLQISSLTRGPQIFVASEQGRVSNTGLQPTGPYDAPGDIIATEVLVNGVDAANAEKGPALPLILIHKASVRPDGRNPTLLFSPDSSNADVAPPFSGSRLAWLQAGGILAVPRPRNAGVGGGSPHAQAADGWRDLVASAEWLVAQKWTLASRLGLWSVGTGSARAGRTLTERPELFAAWVSEAGIGPDGDLDALWAASPYHRIKDGVPYPAVLLMHGVHHPRVPLWHSTKTAARLMAASTSGKPVLLRLAADPGAGSRGNASRPVLSPHDEALDEQADLFAFMLWQMGMPGYTVAPAPSR